MVLLMTRILQEEDPDVMDMARKAMAMVAMVAMVDMAAMVATEAMVAMGMVAMVTATAMVMATETTATESWMRCKPHRSIQEPNS